MINLSKLRYYLYYYRYNILIPTTVGGIVLYDYLNLKKKRRLAEAKANRIVGVK